MKPHLVLKLRNPVNTSIPYWEDVIAEKHNTSTSFSTVLDSAFIMDNTPPVWVTQNYRPQNRDWSKHEIESGLNRIYRIILQENANLSPQLTEKIRLSPNVEYVYPGEVAESPIPTVQYAQSSSLTAPYPDHKIFLQEAHFFSKGNPEIKIAVLDTGFDTEHPELRDAMLPGKDFVDIIHGSHEFIGDSIGIDNEPDDEVGHGTHVAGIIAGKGDRMPIGVVPSCKILPVRVLGALKRGNSLVGAGLIDNINNGIKWAVDQGADIINMSLGIKHKGGGLPHEEVIRYALLKGVSVIAASGNDGTFDKYYPGALPGVIAVGASDPAGGVASFSTFGAHVSLIAPGVNIYSTSLGKGYAISSGTSQAAPFVAGTVALLKSISLQGNRQLGDRQIKHILKHTSDKITQQFKDVKAGYGRINLLDAIKFLRYNS